ncbi:STRN4 protein, partial [Toxostoma redivivum]|nr:STRN4 protein [Toxostoma redivivum]
DPGVLRGVLDGHSDAVWGLAFDVPGRHLASCSADGTVRLWDPRGDSGGGTAGGTCLSVLDGHKGVPDQFCPPGGSGQVNQVALTVPSCPLTCPQVSPGVPDRFCPPGGSGQVNQVVAHPSQPLTITASDDRGIRYLDNRTGKVVHSMVAHLDAVTCLALDPSGAFLLSGMSAGHEFSLRLWHLCQRTCVQELPAHRRKHEEAVLAVAFHPRRALSASAGADALAKVFV